MKAGMGWASDSEGEKEKRKPTNLVLSWKKFFWAWQLLFTLWKLFFFFFLNQFGKEIKPLAFFFMKGFIERAYLIFWVGLFQLSFRQREYLSHFNVFYSIRDMPQADQNDSILRIMSNLLPKSTLNSRVPVPPAYIWFPDLWRMLAPGQLYVSLVSLCIPSHLPMRLIDPLNFQKCFVFSYQ